jgi:hypothetical protein
VTGSTDHPFKGRGVAFRTIYIHLFAGIDKEFFKDIAALKASKFKNWHSFFLLWKGPPFKVPGSKVGTRNPAFDG